MAEPAVTMDRETHPVAILFPQEAVQVIDIFRALADFEEHYDVAALDAIEARLACITSREAAKGIVSDALLLAFGLRRERARPVAYRPVQSRQGTLDEYRLFAMIGGAYHHDFPLAARAAAALDVAHPQPLVSLAFDIARRLEASGMTLPRPNPHLFWAEDPAAPSGVIASSLSAGDLRFSFDA